MKNLAVEVVGPDGGVTSFEYDENNNIVRTEYQNGVSRQRNYDELNRVTSITDRDGDGGPDSVLSIHVRRSWEPG